MSERGLSADLASVVGLRGKPGPPPAMSVVLHVFKIKTKVNRWFSLCSISINITEFLHSNNFTQYHREYSLNTDNFIERGLYLEIYLFKCSPSQTENNEISSRRSTRIDQLILIIWGTGANRLQRVCCSSVACPQTAVISRFRQKAVCLCDEGLGSSCSRQIATVSTLTSKKQRELWFTTKKLTPVPFFSSIF